MKTQFPIDPALTAIAIAYRNPDKALIADAVFPRVPVKAVDFTYTSYGDTTSGYRLPDTRVGPTSRINRVELKGQRIPGTCDDNAIGVPLSFYDTNTSGEGVDAKKLATEFATNIVTMRHEVDVASLVFSLASYPTARRQTLSGTAQFSDYTNSDPIGVILTGLDTALVRPNVLVFGQRSWSVLRRHPHIVSACQGNEGTRGAASKEAVAELFEVGEVLVGEGWLDTSLPGATPVMTRVWGNHIAGIYRDRVAASSGGLTFGATFQYGTRIAGTIDDPEMGLRGGQLAKVGESTKPTIVAADAAFFWENAVAAS